MAKHENRNLIYFSSDEHDQEKTAPHKWEICRSCRGEGKSSAYLGAFTQDDMEEEGPEFVEDYVNGVYDQTCEECNGTGKVKVADFSQMTPAEVAAFREDRLNEADLRAMEESERRLGC
jgi:hypothetical protein